MIRESRKQYEILRLFLSERMKWDLSDSAEGAVWQPGRQSGGYYKCDIGTSRWCDVIRDAIHMASAATGEPKAWDAYLLYYPCGSFVDWHKDPPPSPGLIHRRLNAIIREPDSGGELLLRPDDATTALMDGTVMLTEGDAVIFSPSDVSHCVRPVCRGSRLVFSFGWVEDRK